MRCAASRSRWSAARNGARACDAQRDPRTLVDRYNTEWDYEIGAELRDSVLLQHYLFADRRRIARIIAGANREPTITQLILDYAVGRLSYRSLRRRLIVRAPWLASRLAWDQLVKKTVVEPLRRH